jgi:hypothetical protein
MRYEQKVVTPYILGRREYVYYKTKMIHGSGFIKHDMFSIYVYYKRKMIHGSGFIKHDRCLCTALKKTENN